MCSSAGSTPAVADIRTRLAHGREQSFTRNGDCFGRRVPNLKLYDDGYYRPRSPTGRGQCHTDSGFGRAVWLCPLTFRPHISQWSGSRSRLDSSLFPGATARETVRTLRVQGERRRLMASSAAGGDASVLGAQVGAALSGCRHGGSAQGRFEVAVPGPGWSRFASAGGLVTPGTDPGPGA